MRKTPAAGINAPFAALPGQLKQPTNRFTVPLPRATMYFSRLSFNAVCGMLPITLYLKLEPSHPSVASLLHIHTNPYPSTRLTLSQYLLSLHPPSHPYLTLPSFLPQSALHCTAPHTNPHSTHQDLARSSPPLPTPPREPPCFYPPPPARTKRTQQIPRRRHSRASNAPPPYFLHHRSFRSHILYILPCNALA